MPAQTPGMNQRVDMADGTGGAPGPIESIQDVEYGKMGNRELHMSIAVPRVATPKPMAAVLYFHGGSFVKGDYKQIPIMFLAKRGYFVASVEYRFSDEAQFPAQLQDAQLAVRWLRANAKKYNVDPNHIGVWGVSAGAIICQWLGTMRRADGFTRAGGYDDVDDSVQAVVSFFGTSDATLGPRIGKVSTLHKFAEQLFGCTYEEHPEKWKRFSAINYVRADDPPFFIVQGELDRAAIPEQGIEMGKALTAVNVPNEVIIAKNAGHVWGAPPGSPPPDPKPLEARAKAVAFIDRYLKQQ
jgi:acetyl esterase/lipase